MSTYVLRDPIHGYFRGVLDGEDVVWTQKQRRALRFGDRDMAELAMVGYCPDADVVRLKRRASTSNSENGGG